MNLECTVAQDGHARVIAYAIDRTQSKITPVNDAFILWVGCRDESSAEAKAVMAAARNLSDPTSRNMNAAIQAITEHTGTSKAQATKLVQAIIDGVEAAKQHARDKQ